MPLRDRAVLELIVADRLCVFELQADLSVTHSVDKSYIASDRGQFLSEVAALSTQLLLNRDEDADVNELLDDIGTRRQGLNLDGGGGQRELSIGFSIGPKADPWGDGSGGSDVTRFDASGEADLIAKAQVLEWAVSQNRSDSQGFARLYLGQWSDGTYAAEPGAFDEPLSIAIDAVRLERDETSPSEVEGTLECRATEVLGDPTAETEELAEDAVPGLDDLGDSVRDEVTGVLPEFG